ACASSSPDRARTGRPAPRRPRGRRGAARRRARWRHYARRAMADYETLLVRRDDGVAWVSLNRPEVRNAINPRMQRERAELWTAFRVDDEVRCVVLAGEGDSFCTRTDRNEAMSEEHNAAMAAGDLPGYPTSWMFDDPG